MSDPQEQISVAASPLRWKPLSSHALSLDLMTGLSESRTTSDRPRALVIAHSSP